MTGGSLDVRKTATSHVVVLARPVPPNGQGRLRIEKTVRSAKAYAREGRIVVFTETLGSRRGSVVLPAGFELLSCNVPAQVLSEPDGRIGVAYMNQMDRVSLVLKARSGIAVGASAAPKPLTDARSWEPPPAQGPTERARFAERAHQDRDITYFLNDPATSSFSLFHDYTESRPGIDKYINVVREGSRVSKPSVYILDTGEKLADETLKGPEITAAKLDIGQPVTPDTEVVVVRFPPVTTGRSIRLRISETYTAPQSYRVDGQDSGLRAEPGAAARLGRAAGRLVSHRVVHSFGGVGNIRREDPSRFRQRPPRQHRRPHQGPPPTGFLTRSPT